MTVDPSTSDRVPIIVYMAQVDLCSASLGKVLFIDNPCPSLDLLVDLTGYMRHFGMTGLSCQTYAASAVGW